MKNHLYQAELLRFMLAATSEVSTNSILDDPSTKYRQEICPECKELHNREGHIFCSDKCQQERKIKLRSGELE